MLSRFSIALSILSMLCVATLSHAQSPTPARALPTAKRAQAPAVRPAPAARWIEVRPVQQALPRRTRTTRTTKPLPSRLAPRAAVKAAPVARQPAKARPLPQALKVVGGRMQNTLRSGAVLSKPRMRRMMAFYLQRAQANKRSKIQLTRDQEVRARSLSDMIIAPCCYTQPASIHGNAMANAVKASLRWLVSQGYNDSQIKLAFVNAYHPRILSVPANKSIYVIPMLVAVLALFFVGFVTWRWTKKADGAEFPEDDDHDYNADEEYDDSALYEEQSGA